MFCTIPGIYFFLVFLVFQIFTAKYCNGLLDLGGSPPLHEMPAATVSLKVLTADCSSVWKLSASSSAVGETDTHHGTFNK